VVAAEVKASNARRRADQPAQFREGPQGGKSRVAKLRAKDTAEKAQSTDEKALEKARRLGPKIVPALLARIAAARGQRPTKRLVADVYSLPGPHGKGSQLICWHGCGRRLALDHADARENTVLPTSGIDTAGNATSALGFVSAHPM